MPRAIIDGLVLADSPTTVIVEGNHYFPPESVHREHLSDTSTQTVCPWKGTAHYYAAEVDGDTIPDIAWYYPQPRDQARAITGHVAFASRVTIEDDDS